MMCCLRVCVVEVGCGTMGGWKDRGRERVVAPPANLARQFLLKHSFEMFIKRFKHYAWPTGQTELWDRFKKFSQISSESEKLSSLLLTFEMFEIWSCKHRNSTATKNTI